MKNFHLLIVFYFFCSSSAFCQALTTHDHRLFGGLGNDFFTDVFTYMEGDEEYIIAAGRTSLESSLNQEYQGGFNDVMVAKFDSDNNVIWSANYGGSDIDVANAVVPTNDGGFLVAGSTRSSDGDVSENAAPFTQDFWILKLNNSGDLVWEQTYGGVLEDVALDMIATSDGNYVVGGTAQSGLGDNTVNNGAEDFWIIKIDPEGEVIWKEVYGGIDNEHLESLLETADGNIVASGWTRSIPSGDVEANYGLNDYWVIKLDASGQLIWKKHYGGSNSDSAYEVLEDGDGNYLVFGYAESDDNDVSQFYGASDMWLIKIDPDGDLIWEKTYGGTGSDIGYDVKFLPEGNGDMLLIGLTDSDDGHFDMNLGEVDGGILWVDSDGNVVESHVTGGSEEDIVLALYPRSGQKMSAVGITKSGDGDLNDFDPFGNRDHWLFTIDDLVLSTAEPHNFTELFYPNPSNGEFYFTGNLQYASIFRITDLMGREVSEGFIGPCANCSFQIEGKGIYILEIQTEKGMIRERILVE